MLIDIQRLEKYLDQITTETIVIKKILDFPNSEILNSPPYLRGLKYSIIVISEAMANTLQHLLAKIHNQAITGYKEIFIKSLNYKLLSTDLLNRLQPFISFRNMLVHQYWRVDDEIFINNLRNGIDDFKQFVKEINHLVENTSNHS